MALALTRLVMLSLNPYPDGGEISALSPERIAQIPQSNMRSYADETIARMLQSRPDVRDIPGMVIPSPGRILAMLIDDRDSEEYQDISGLSYPADIAYMRIAAMHPEMTALRDKYGILFSSLYNALNDRIPPIPATWVEKNANSWHGDVTLPRLFSLPRPQDLDYSHTFALDIFLQNVEYLKGDVQRGPIIHSLRDGIVVAAESGWTGYPRKNHELSYIRGGISPKSGNGVIVYSPEENRYFFYFHLYDVAVDKGQIVRRGQPLGHAGNTGINARKQGGGDHLHIEIFDANRGKYLKNTQIIALLKDSGKRKPAISPQ